MERKVKKEAKSHRVTFRSILLALSLSMNGLLLSRSFWENNFVGTANIQENWAAANETAAARSGFVHYPKLIGHLHYAKTAGTEINAALAAKYERVCGHKGYSFDFSQFNQRMKFSIMEKEQRAAQIDKEGAAAAKYNADDIVSRAYPGHDRGRVPIALQKEIGFEDCDYVSMEEGWKRWVKLVSTLEESTGEGINMELHVPCRDPLSHLMSQCNFKRLVFRCNARDLRKEVERCLLKVERFDERLVNATPAIELMCFDPIPIEPYLDYMGQYLQPRRWETVNYVHRLTNLPRNKTNECIWYQSDDFRNQVLRILFTKDYYKFCARCMITTNNLLLRLEHATRIEWKKFEHVLKGVS
mmetsp:Transcript_24683/g.70821  ORF Transcript_24683/g.70821 Transcript_24683/m.70821 type:complete len:357 (-) Transcript_24683:75-1145(-)|eukprot:CAMPEP_0176005358 /NCGR_PEP_ID=MMETSP0120_2-20121206/2164_1 /TAXON_ID=160619 /ORGANISM="Kryptoperidinium foliaceum, Strain CCMP 1326" /LENGTH=356 /DNA_ID=CAMNT_0017338061 /DNA_START=104 /DNA_END=1174 /DNA_ORIENTATION=+